MVQAVTDILRGESKQGKYHAAQYAVRSGYWLNHLLDLNKGAKSRNLSNDDQAFN